MASLHREHSIPEQLIKTNIFHQDLVDRLQMEILEGIYIPDGDSRQELKLSAFPLHSFEWSV